jgi:dTDP-4-amino-4,6-dideoxygalactose transaminase
MKDKPVSRRQFLATTSTGAVAVITSNRWAKAAEPAKKGGPLALSGGQPVRTKPWPSWPVWDPAAENDILAVLRSGNWYRGQGTRVTEFEKRYAELMGAKRCVATASGTTALITALHVLGVDAGDEVIVSPYTFVASYNVIFMVKALPVFADTDPETFTIDPARIEERITDRTRAILPVHILGLPVNMDPIMAIAKKHNLVVVEDACQAWLAEYKNRKCGTIGDLGCFSFQNSKHLPAGEGGAVVGLDETVVDRCHSYHNCGRAFGTFHPAGGNAIRGTNFRMQEFQAVILMSQMKRLEADTQLREQNARYLSSRLKDIPGITPYKLNPGATRAVHYLYPFRYKPEAFNQVPREKFLKALDAEGVPCSGGYGPQNKDGLIEEALNSRGYQRLFSKERLDRYRHENVLPQNDQLCREAVWFTQNLLLGSRQDMDDIADAVEKIYENRDKLA